MTCKILLPVDGSEGSLRAARHVVDIAVHIKDLEVHLVNVQPTGDDWMVRRMIKAEELEKLERDWSETALSPARDILRAAGITTTSHTRQGDVAPSIVDLAERLACDQIVMGTRGLSSFADLFMGSNTHKVLHLARIPVTLVK